MNYPAQPDASASRSAAMERIWMLGIVLWPSLLAACLASLLFFAAVDPLLLRDAGPRLFDELEREGGYALGFFFFWFIYQHLIDTVIIHIHYFKLKAMPLEIVAGLRNAFQFI